jgi:leucyl aminopeptidase
MDIKKILGYLDPKNQNLPKIELGNGFKNIPVIFVPVVENEEKHIEKLFPFSKKIKISGKKGERKGTIHNNQEYSFIGIGEAANVNSRNMRRLFGSLYLSSLGNEPKSIGFYCEPEWIRIGALAVHVAALNPSMFKTKPKKEAVPEVFFVNPEFKKNRKDAEKELKAGITLAKGKNIMRVLGTLPPNILTIPVYAEVIMELAKKWKVKCERISKDKLEKYNLLNAVSSGSVNKSELLIFTMHPKSGATKKSTAFIGKGLIYDSGGVQGKGQYMKSMKEDMAGSASVLGVILNIVEGGLELKETTYFLLPLAENMMGSNAMRADDVYTAGDGQTVEIGNTDAEGRLALADAICYVKNNFKEVNSFITIATLTGSCIIALGEHYTGVICNNEEMGKEVTKTGKEVGEYMHIAPWDLDYDDNNSPYADMQNIAEKDREAGWIKAGLFIYKFVPKAKKPADQAKFCHLDIAATIDMDEKGKSWRRKGFNSGIGVGLISKLLTK